MAIFVLMVLESACVPIPSEVTMLFGGALTSAAFAGQRQRAQPLLGRASRGSRATWSGSWLAYWVGKAGGRPLIDRFGRYLLIRPHEVDRAHVWFERRGEAAVFVARLLPVVRTFISLPAGVAEMPFWKFTTLHGARDASRSCTRWRSSGTWPAANWEKVENVLAPFSLADPGRARRPGRGLRDASMDDRCVPSTRRSTRSARTSRSLRS